MPFHIVQISLSFASVVQRQAIGVFLLDEETGRLEFGITKPHVLVQIVQAIEEVSHMSTQYPFLLTINRLTIT